VLCLDRYAKLQDQANASFKQTTDNRKEREHKYLTPARVSLRTTQ
jgi:hypothetical protein